MPVIPGVNTPEVKAAATNTPYFTVKATAEDFGSGIGKSMQTLGESLGKASSAIEAYSADQAKRQKEVDTSNAVDVTTRFQAKLQDVEQSFYGLSGQPAATGMSAIATQVNRLKQDALSSAQTPEAAQLALGAINGLANQSVERMARHADSQQTVYDNDLDQQRMMQSKLAIAQSYNDDDAFVVNSHIADQSAQHIAIRGARAADGAITAGQAIAAADAVRPPTMSELITARIGGALMQKDLPYADKLIAKYGGELLPADRALVDQQYHAVQFQSQLRTETERVSAVAQPQPDGNPTSGGGYHNADRVLHRSSDATADSGVQLADASGTQEQASPGEKPGGEGPVSGLPAGNSTDASAPSDGPAAGAGNQTSEPPFPGGSQSPAYSGEEKAMGDEVKPGQKLSPEMEARRANALTAIRTVQRPEFWPLAGDHKLNVKDSTIPRGDGRFGWVRTAADGQPKAHQGIDFAAKLGAPVYAVSDGVVKRVVNDVPFGKNGNYDYGNEIVIEHSGGIHTQYAHLKPTTDADGKPISGGGGQVQLLLKVGDTVKAGQLIGYVGNTGNAGAKNPQLHYEVRYGDGISKKQRIVLNPAYFLPGPEGAQ